MKVLFITNIPSPYRIDFFNLLGQYVDLTVLFEARRASGIQFNWNDNDISSFKPIFLKNGYINERKIDFSINKYIAEDIYDYIFITNYSYFTELFAVLSLAIRKRTYYMELDGALLNTKESRFKYILKKYILMHADAYFSPSETTDLFLQNYGVEKNRIVRYPFSSLSKSQIAQKALSRKEKINLRYELDISYEYMVLAVGQFIHRKGFDILLEVAKDLDASIGVYFVGGKPTQEYLEYVNSNNLINVHFLGFKKTEELRKYYQAADIFVLPTREDVWGLVINEAMANGLPIITTIKCGAGKELVKNGVNGRLIQPESTQELKSSILSMLNNQDKLTRMGEESLRIISKYTIEGMVEAHIGFLMRHN